MAVCARSSHFSVALLLLSLFNFVASLKLADNHESHVQGRRLQLRKVTEVGSADADADRATAAAAADAVAAAATEGNATSAAAAEGVAATHKPDVLTVTAGKDIGQLHMVMFNLPPGEVIKVDSVDKGYWAEKVGIEHGSVILTINGKLAKDMSQEDFINGLKERPVKLTIQPPEESTQKPVIPLAPKPVSTGSSGLKPFGATDKATGTAPPHSTAQVRGRAPSMQNAAVQGQDTPPGDAALSNKALEAAAAAGHAAGMAAGTATAKQLVEELKKVLGVSDDMAPEPRRQQDVPATPPAVAQAPAPAPFAWQKVIPEFKALDDIPRTANSGIPEPVPPSPMDALRAAMAIRANMSGHGPLLTPEVIDEVARMARSRLGNYVPHAPAPCPPGAAAAPAPGPTVFDGPTIEKVEVEMTIKNMSFTALQASPSMMAEFEQSVKQSMAESAGPGVKPSDIEVQLKSGSVVVEAKITPPKGQKASDMDKNMANGAGSIGTRLIARVKALPGIDTVALGDLSASPVKVKVVQELLPTTQTTTTTPPTRHLPKPPKCAGPPPKMTKGEVRMALAPFKPPGAKGGSVKTADGGQAWPLQDGGWAFQYPDMALRMQEDGSTRIVWAKPAYSVEYDESGISYHVGENVVHRDTNGDLTYQQPTGTMHQEGSTTVYHWCNPNVIVYQTPAGFVYYDDMGMTYRSFGKDVTHYTWSGEVLYQGAGGITRQGTDGSVTHWTDAGAVFRHADGSVSYTPVGERTSQALSVSDLGPDPFPGAELTTEDVMKLSVPAAPLVPVPVPVVPVPAAF